MALGPVLVTGASTGIGLLTAVELARRGHRVIATMRDPAKQERLQAAARASSVPVTVMQLDVCDGDSIAACAREIHQRHGALHALVNNAGIGIGGFFEDVEEDEIRANFETNFFGLLAVTRAFLGPMREAGRGYVLNVSSVAGRIANAGMSAYISTKFAVEGFTESLRHEMSRFGVQVVLIEPGMFRTEIFESNLKLCRRAQEPASPYFRLSQKLLANIQKQVSARAADPRTVALVIAGVLADPSPRLRYPVGTDARLGIFLKWLLPERLFLALVSRATRG